MGPAVVVGRERERALIATWVESLVRGAPSGTLVVRGPPGIGKTTLWLDALNPTESAGVAVVRTRPSEADVALGYAGLTDLLAPCLASWQDQLPGHLADALSSSLLLSAPSGKHDQLAVYRGTQLALEVLAAGAEGLLVAVDDVQWLDPASARAIGYALRRWSGPPIAVAVTWREGTKEPIGLDALPGTPTLVELAPLSGIETTRLVASHRPDATWPRVGFLARMSGGNPFYALELARSAEDDVVPASLHEAAARRLSAARQAGRPAIELAAVVGPTPSRTFDDESLGAALDVAVEDHILVVDHLVRFDHPLLAWAAYEALPPRRRSALHRSAAHRSTSVEARATHLAKAATDPNVEVAALLDKAGAAAYERFAMEAAADFAADAARLTDPTDVRVLARRYADLAWYRLGWDDPGTRAALETVLGLVVDGPDRGRALYLKAYTAKDWKEAVRASREALAEPGIAPELTTQLRMEYVWAAGVLLGDDPGSAAREASAIVADAAGLGADVRLGLMTITSVISSYAGLPEAVERFEACRVMTESGVRPRNHLPVWGVYATHFARRGDWGRAIDLLDIGERSAARMGHDVDLGHAHQTRAWIEYVRGDTDEMDRRLALAADLSRRDVDLGDRISRLANLVQARRGQDPTDAMSQARAISDETLILGPPGMNRIVRGVGLVALGQAEQAADLFLALPSVIGRPGSMYLRLELVAPEAVTALVAAGRLEDARQVADGIEHWGRRGPLGTVLADLCHGIIELGSGAPDASETLARARGGAAGLDARWLEAMAAYAGGHALRRRGRRRLAADAFTHAAILFTAMRVPPWAERATEAPRLAVPRPRHDAMLTPAETNVVEAAAEGLSNAEIAARLYVTVATVEAHLTRAYRKLGVRSRAGLNARLRRPH